MASSRAFALAIRTRRVSADLAPLSIHPIRYTRGPIATRRSTALFGTDAIGDGYARARARVVRIAMAAAVEKSGVRVICGRSRFAPDAPEEISDEEADTFRQGVEDYQPYAAVNTTRFERSWGGFLYPSSDTRRVVAALASLPQAR